jgi:hypothetical protein
MIGQIGEIFFLIAERHIVFLIKFWEQFLNTYLYYLKMSFPMYLLLFHALYATKVKTELTVNFGCLKSRLQFSMTNRRLYVMRKSA